MRLPCLYMAVLLSATLAGCASGSGIIEPEVKRSYTKTVVREAASEFEASLIAQAEAVYPPRDTVVARAWDPAQVAETEYWYHHSFDGVRIPYALTGDAVAYYADLIDTLQADTSEAGERLRSFTHASLDYKATASFRDVYTFEGEDPLTREPLPSESFERVYVVHMSLEWSQHCGNLCAMWISHERVVVFDEAGTLLRVFLDGPRPSTVS